VLRDIESLLEERAFTTRGIFAIDLAMQIGVLSYVGVLTMASFRPPFVHGCLQAVMETNRYDNERISTHFTHTCATKILRGIFAYYYFLI
jgi:hypothetical protein